MPCACPICVGRSPNAVCVSYLCRQLPQCRVRVLSVSAASPMPCACPICVGRSPMPCACPICVGRSSVGGALVSSLQFAVAPAGSVPLWAASDCCCARRTDSRSVRPGHARQSIMGVLPPAERAPTPSACAGLLLCKPVATLCRVSRSVSDPVGVRAWSVSVSVSVCLSLYQSLVERIRTALLYTYVLTYLQYM